MKIDHAMWLMSQLIEVTIMVAGPLLAAALVGGVLIGVVQTVTQINEMSLAYVVKAACILAILATFGTSIVEYAIRYTRTSIASIADVVH